MVEPVEIILPKLDQAGEFFWRIGVHSDGDADVYGNVKLMKLLYIFYLKYVQLNGGVLQEGDPFKTYRFFAWPYGPVEPSVYDNIGIVRRRLGNLNFADGEWVNFTGANRGFLVLAFEFVIQHFWYMSANQLIDYTHCTLSKWRQTPLYGEMMFKNQIDFESEYQALPA